ncbi:MAG: PAS domain-containing protein [Candidatus Glassbacteria bacterium]|nr:PAS domain-containing protein [Candidatus Glassbacteria bacterium]
MTVSDKILDLIHEHVECGIFAVDADCRVIYWNAAAERITGRTAAEMIGSECCDTHCLNCINQEREKPDERSPLADNGEEFKAGECVLRRPDGSMVRVLKNVRAMRDESGNLIGAVECLTDVSSIKPDLTAYSSGSEQHDETAPVPGMIGRGQAMREVYRLVRFAADSESTVLITGESGTGKELIARAIHQLGRRSSGPLVAVSCSALPESLLESELFGHVKGAFSGAVRDKVGRFELAGGGTVFLDEIGDISPLIQLKLLRVLQNQEYQRVGESATRTADVRIIAATNKNLLEAVRRGEFREDLFFRLKVFPVALPPLRDRTGDISELVQYFIDLFNRKTGKHVERIDHEAMKLLMDYCWPGNVRELEHAIEYAFVLCQTSEITPFMLPQEILRVEFRKQMCPPGQQNFLYGTPAGAQGGQATPPPAGRTRPGREELLQALESNGWNQSATARYFGVSRVTVWNWINKFGIEKP